MRFVYLGSRFMLHASFPRSVALTQLRFACLAVASSAGDSHPEDRAHAGRTRKRPSHPKMLGLEGLKIKRFALPSRSCSSRHLLSGSAHSRIPGLFPTDTASHQRTRIHADLRDQGAIGTHADQEDSCRRMSGSLRISRPSLLSPSQDFRLALALVRVGSSPSRTIWWLGGVDSLCACTDRLHRPRQFHDSVCSFRASHQKRPLL